MARLTPEEIAEIRGTLGTEISARGTVVRRLLAHISALEEELAPKEPTYYPAHCAVCGRKVGVSTRENLMGACLECAENQP